MSRYTVLDAEHNLVPADLFTWGRFFDDTGARTVARSTLPGSDVYVSTVFLGMDHSWGEGPSLWFETMVFRGPFDEHQWRWTTWDEAAAGHERIVAALTAGTDPGDAGAPG